VAFSYYCFFHQTVRITIKGFISLHTIVMMRSEGVLSLCHHLERKQKKALLAQTPPANNRSAGNNNEPQLERRTILLSTNGVLPFNRRHYHPMPDVDSLSSEPPSAWSQNKQKRERENERKLTAWYHQAPTEKFRQVGKTNRSSAYIKVDSLGYRHGYSVANSSGHHLIFRRRRS
jgi:hypothetical protein